eukprot:249197-Hanusia_phi.AAC.2
MSRHSSPDCPGPNYHHLSTVPVPGTVPSESQSLGVITVWGHCEGHDFAGLPISSAGPGTYHDQ